MGIFNGKCIRLHSPKSYNYGGDELYFDIYIKHNLKFMWDKYLKKLKDTDTLEDF